MVGVWLVEAGKVGVGEWVGGDGYMVHGSQS